MRRGLLQCNHHAAAGRTAVTCACKRPRSLQVFKAKDQTKYFWIEHWKAFLDSCSFLGTHGLAHNDARLIFGWSQMVVTDELKKRQRAVSLLNFDFVEVCSKAVRDVQDVQGASRDR